MNTWKVINEAICKKKEIGHDLLKHMIINGMNIFDEETIATGFSKYFVNVFPNLASNIQCTDKKFEDFLTKSITTLQGKDLFVNELKDALYSLKPNKSLPYYNINYDAIRNAFGSLLKLLKHVFNLSLTKGIFHDKLKIARVIPIFKVGGTLGLGNYRPISVLPCFSKMLERIINYTVFEYLIKKISYIQNSLVLRMDILLTMQFYSCFMHIY